MRHVPSLQFDSDALAPADRFEVWRTAVAPIHDTFPGADRSDTSFSVRSTVWNLSGVVLAHGSYSAMKAERSAALARRTGGSYRLSLIFSGASWRLSQGDNRLILRPGDLSVANLEGPSGQETLATSEMATLYLSQSAVDAFAPQAAGIDMLCLQGPLAVLLRDHLIGLVGALRGGCIPDETAPNLAQASTQLFAAALAGSVPPDGEGRGVVEDALRRRMIGFIEKRLLDPALNQDLLCRTFHMSRATLYRLFQPLGGVAAFVRERRLARVHSALLDPTHQHHLGRLAETYGFASAAQMGRAYKSRYGMSPRDAITPASYHSDDRQSGEQPTFRQWMRGLGG